MSENILDFLLLATSDLLSISFKICLKYFITLSALVFQFLLTQELILSILHLVHEYLQLVCHVLWFHHLKGLYFVPQKTLP